MSVIRATSVGPAICRYLRAQHRTRTAENVAADLHPSWGFKAATIAKMLDRETMPSCKLMMALVGAYGPEFLSAVYPGKLPWLHEATDRSEREAIRAELEALQQRLSAL